MPTALTPHLVVNDGSAASEFYQKAFGAVEVFRMPADDGRRLMHCCLNIGPTKIYLCDDFPEYCDGNSRSPKALGGTPVTLHLDVPDCDAAIDQAVAAGASVTMPAMDAFWGDRYGKIQDPFGHEWSFSTPLSPERTAAAAAAWEAFKTSGKAEPAHA
jgi:PhnB protein